MSKNATLSYETLIFYEHTHTCTELGPSTISRTLVKIITTMVPNHEFWNGHKFTSTHAAVKNMMMPSYTSAEMGPTMVPNDYFLEMHTHVIQDTLKGIYIHTC